MTVPETIVSVRFGQRLGPIPALGAILVASRRIAPKNARFEIARPL